MSPTEYQELIAFLGERFGRIDARFDEIERRLDGVERRLDRVERRLDGIEARLLKVEVTQEQMRDLIKLNAESILGVRNELASFRTEVETRFDRVEYRVTRLEVA